MKSIRQDTQALSSTANEEEDMQTNSIECPNCGTSIDIQQALFEQIGEQIKAKYQHELDKEKADYRRKMEGLDKQRAALEQERRAVDETIQTAIDEGLTVESEKLASRIRAEIEAEQSEAMKELNTQLQDQSAKLKDYNKTKAAIEKLKREKEELKDEIEAESERRLSEELGKAKEKIRQREEENTRLKIAEKEKVILTLNEKLKEAQRKAEQGSVQLQGEVQEVAIEEWLQEQFPLDTIEEIKKGARGADCMQIVNTRVRPECGKIYYESKRTKAFHETWIEKFKADIREKRADIGVLVTETMPNGMDRMGLRNGVWVCSFEEFFGLSHVLRQYIVNLSEAVASQENRGDKMAMLYDYLTGTEFRHQVEAIVEGFTQMQSELEAEKRAMAGIWKKREKQIEKVLLNTNYMYSSVKGIAGSAVQSVPLLELADNESADDTD